MYHIKVASLLWVTPHTRDKCIMCGVIRGTIHLYTLQVKKCNRIKTLEIDRLNSNYWNLL
jgi:hypothetical protein